MEPMTDNPSSTVDPAAEPPYANEAPKTVEKPLVTSGVNDPRRKSPLLASVLSLMPGLGQVYVGFTQRGFVHAAVVAVLITIVVSLSSEELFPLFGLSIAFFWFYNVIDAGRRAAMYNEVLAGRSTLELPDDIDFKMPSLGGSIAGGVSLIAFGLILLSNTAFDFSLRWVEDWWPAAFVLFGAYLVFRARQDAAPSD